MNDAAPWLERELTRQLAPVTAPASLWSRIERPQPRASLRWVAWPAVAIVTLIACAGLLRRIDQASDFEFRSNDFSTVRAWVKAQADIDIDLPGDLPTFRATVRATAETAPIRVSGARLIRVKGVRVAAIDYRVGVDSATLFVSGRRSTPGENSVAPRHVFSGMESSGKTRLVSWNRRNQSYTIAFSGVGDTRGACLVCHANMPGLLTMN